jgi:TP901-1 family phage major tail protein
MAKYAGNDLVLQVRTNPGATAAAAYGTVGGASSHTWTLTNSQVDTSDKDSSGWGEMQPFGRRQIAFSFNGFVSDNANFELVHTSAKNDTILEYQIDYGNSDTVTGNFHIDSFEIGGEAEGAQTFSISMTSSGTMVFA